MAKKNNNVYEQVYNLNEDETLSSQVGPVICILVQRGVLVAGFSNKKELLTLHYTGYNKSKPVWEVAFFEQLFAHEPLLADKSKVRGVFILSGKHLLVPDDLYDKTHAENWLRKIHFIEQSDTIRHYPLKDTKARYLLAIPVNITELIRINFGKAATLPVPTYQFRNVPKKDAIMHCAITAEQVSATLHNNGQLLWHKVFTFANAEDIAYTLMQVCAEHHIAQNQVTVRCNAISVTEFVIINSLSQYFTGITSGDGTPYATSWDSAAKLAQQLFSCV